MFIAVARPARWSFGRLAARTQACLLILDHVRSYLQFVWAQPEFLLKECGQLGAAGEE